MSALFIILVGLTMTGFSEKMLVSTRCISTWFHVQLDQKILDGLYCLFTTILSYAQLFKWGHSNLAVECNCGRNFLFLGHAHCLFVFNSFTQCFTKALTRLFITKWWNPFRSRIILYIEYILATVLTLRNGMKLFRNKNKLSKWF